MTIAVPQRPRAHVAAAVFALAFASSIAGLGAASADPVSPLRPHHAPLVRTAAAPALTVHRHRAHAIVGASIGVDDGFYDGSGLLRRWDDPRLYSFYGWRLGGDNFYGDQRGAAITRGNAGLGMIAGYGGARGGYGGPHFDSVGGFHNGPGPLAKEDADYASGSIGQPDYDFPQPRYPSVTQRVADLDTGLAGTGQVTRTRSPRERWAEAYHASYPSRAAEPVSFEDPFD